MPETDWELRPYREGDAQGILDLFNAVFREENPYHVDRTLDQWRWTFEGAGFDHQTWVAERQGDGKLIGQYTAIPAYVHVKGQKLLISQAVDTCVDSDYRRSLKREGLFLSLARTWFEHWGREGMSHIVYGFPNNRAFPVGTRVLHYRPLHCPVPKLTRASSPEGLNRTDAVKIEEVDRFDSQVDALYERLKDDHGLSTYRDHAYLNWRYVDHPLVDYKILYAKRGADLSGYLVYRIGWLDRATVPLVDILCDLGDRETLETLVAHAASAATDANQPTLETWMPSGFAHCQALESMGFQAEEGQFNLCIRIFCSYFDMGYADRKWYYTMGDSDIY